MVEIVAKEERGTNDKRRAGDVCLSESALMTFNYRISNPLDMVHDNDTE